MVDHDAVVLAGGAARRLGGAAKPEVVVRGRRLLDHVLEATGQARAVVVVAPSTVPIPDGAIRTLEDPPLGGPVAGLAAGLAALTDPAPWVLLLACDLPGAAAAVPRLLAAAEGKSAVPGEYAVGKNCAVGENCTFGATGWDGVVVRDGEGRLQWLLGIYRTTALARRLAQLTAERGARGASVHALLAPLRLRALDARGEEADDVDTWQAVTNLENRQPRTIVDDD